MRRRSAALAGTLLTLALTAACSSNDAIDATAAQKELGAEAACQAVTVQRLTGYGTLAPGAGVAEVRAILGEPTFDCADYDAATLDRLYAAAAQEVLANVTEPAADTACRAALVSTVKPVVTQLGAAADYDSVRRRLQAQDVKIPAACDPINGLAFTRMLKAAILRTGSAAEATNADAPTPNAPPGAETGAGTSERSACKAAVAAQSRRNADIILASGNPEDPRVVRSEPRACSGLDQATKTTLAREVADELVKERQRRP